MIKELYYLAAFIIFFSCTDNSTFREEPASGEETDKQIVLTDNQSDGLEDLKNVDNIKNEYSYITSKIESGKMDSTSFEYNCREEKKGRVIYFSENGQLRMIRHIYSEYSHFSATDKYFIKDGALFFAYFHHVTWSFANHNQTKEDITEKRIYIIDNRPIKCLQKKFTILSNDKNVSPSNMISNKETECPLMEEVSANFESILKFRNQNEDLICLEN